MPELVDVIIVRARTNISAIHIRGAVKNHREPAIAAFAGAEQLEDTPYRFC
ncbi:MAG: hypothetical protein U5L01_16845 [Rheinheimera sp.]|nr:hypothetical protein [Rheinheimera sp.]